MKGYAILDGGGVKGAALAGALAAAEANKIEWLGYGGTSAGSIVATLACVGYSVSELKSVVVDCPFTDLLDDQTGSDLESLKCAVGEVARSATSGHVWFRPVSVTVNLFRHRSVLQKVSATLGVYKGDQLRQWLRKKIIAKHTAFEQNTDITFAELAAQGCPPLKIVASNITHKSAVVFPDDTGSSASVLDAVRASVCFPFLFHPVRLDPKRYVDGGLASNLPVFLFDEEATRVRVPVIAIDLVSKVEAVVTPRAGLGNYFKDMLETVLEGSDKLLRERQRNLHHVKVEINPPVDTLKFNLTQQERDTLFQNGERAFHNYYVRYLRPLEDATDVAQKLQALYASPGLVVPILELIAKTVEKRTFARQVRVHVMLPTPRNTRVVVYQFGMDEMPDRTLELSTDGGCSGVAYSENEVSFADLSDARTAYQQWKMTADQRDRIPENRRAMLSIPIRDTSRLVIGQKSASVKELPVIGTLSIDSVTDAVTANWVVLDKQKQLKINKKLLDFLQKWTDIIGKILT